MGPSSHICPLRQNRNHQRRHLPRNRSLTSTAPHLQHSQPRLRWWRCLCSLHLDEPEQHHRRKLCSLPRSLLERGSPVQCNCYLQGVLYLQTMLSASDFQQLQSWTVLKVGFESELDHERSDERRSSGMLNLRSTKSWKLHRHWCLRIKCIRSSEPRSFYRWLGNHIQQRPILGGEKFLGRVLGR